MSQESSTAFQKEYDKIASNVGCPVLSMNYLKLSGSEFYRQIGQAFMSSQSALDINGAFLTIDRSIDCSLDCYSGREGVLKENFAIPSDIFDEILEICEQLASIYVGLFTLHFMRPIIGEMRDRASKLVERIDQATINWDEDLEDYEKLFFMISMNSDASRRFGDAVQLLINARNQLRELPDFIRQPAIAKACEYGKRAQPSNMALQIWVEAIYSLWVNRLGRSIENKNDGINGRKHLLDFMEALMLPVHEALEYSTLDNMLRKVQRNVECRGGFNHPDFRLGVSSPMGARWSKSES